MIQKYISGVYIPTYIQRNENIFFFEILYLDNANRIEQI